MKREWRLVDDKTKRNPGRDFECWVMPTRLDFLTLAKQAFARTNKNSGIHRFLALVARHGKPSVTSPGSIHSRRARCHGVGCRD
jgi:hypothetical protein